MSASPAFPIRLMETSTILLGTGQLALTLAVGYIAHLLQRDSKRSSLVALVTLLNNMLDKNGKSLAAMFSLMSSNDFKTGDQMLRSGLIDATNRLQAIHTAVTEALLQTLHECDSEWGLAGRLHGAVRAQVDPAVPATEKDWPRVVTQPGTA